MDLISIIVPVYNVEKYLHECIESVIYQDYTNLDIVLIDDGSVDRSGFICDKYANIDERISVIHKKNGGLSAARNAGIEIAKGRYICFVDGDDFIAKDYISSMYKGIVRHKTKIASCGYCRVYENGKKEQINHQNIDMVYMGEIAQKFLNITGYFNVSACNKMFEKNLFNEIKFPEGKNSEDCFIMYKLLDKSGSIYYNSKNKYYYRQRNGSISKSNNINNNAIEAAMNTYNYYISRGWNIATPFAAQLVVLTNIGAYNSILCNAQSSSESQLTLFRNNVFKMKNEFSYKELTYIKKIQIFLFINAKSIYDQMFLLFDAVRRRRYRRF